MHYCSREQQMFLEENEEKNLRLYKNRIQNWKPRVNTIQGVLSQSVQDESVLREGRKDISDILGHFFSRKHMHVLISKLTFMKKKWEIMKNHKIC